MPMAENSAATTGLDQKFDPSVGSQNIGNETGIHPNGVAPTSDLHSAPPTSGLHSSPTANTSEVAPVSAPAEHAAEVPSTTTTTIM